MERYGVRPADIETQSLLIVEELVPAGLLPSDAGARAVAKRMIHASGDPDIAAHIRVPPGAVEAGLAALRRGAPIYTDVRMVSVGINAKASGRLGNAVTCLMSDPRVPEKARQEGITQAAAGVRLHRDQLSGSIVVIGNAPTALLALLDLVDEGSGRPALVIGTPVGFVNAAESKDELWKRDLPCITLLGSRGGSAVAAAATNALLQLAVGEVGPGDGGRDH